MQMIPLSEVVYFVNNCPHIQQMVFNNQPHLFSALCSQPLHDDECLILNSNPSFVWKNYKLFFQTDPLLGNS